MNEGEWTYDKKVAQLDKLARWEQAVSEIFQKAGLGPVRIREVEWLDHHGERAEDVPAGPGRGTD